MVAIVSAFVVAGMVVKQLRSHFLSHSNFICCGATPNQARPVL